jgi:delta-aminolevulinic acid dehydratase/porphobilinogen synthase
MMDGHVTAIKQSLMKGNLLSRVSVLSYSAKFCSVFYGPFRDAANCAPSFSNRSSYQIPVGSSSIAERVVVRITNLDIKTFYLCIYIMFDLIMRRHIIINLYF